MQSRKLRNNEKNEEVTFFTSFNSSSLYTTAGKEGEALVSVLVAIEYPAKYANEKNWFQTSALMKVTS